MKLNAPRPFSPLRENGLLEFNPPSEDIENSPRYRELNQFVNNATPYHQQLFNLNVNDLVNPDKPEDRRLNKIIFNYSPKGISNTVADQYDPRTNSITMKMGSRLHNPISSFNHEKQHYTSFRDEQDAEDILRNYNSHKFSEDDGRNLQQEIAPSSHFNKYSVPGLKKNNFEEDLNLANEFNAYMLENAGNPLALRISDRGDTGARKFANFNIDNLINTYSKRDLDKKYPLVHSTLQQAKTRINDLDNQRNTGFIADRKRDNKLERYIQRQKNISTQQKQQEQEQLLLEDKKKLMADLLKSIQPKKIQTLLNQPNQSMLNPSKTLQRQEQQRKFQQKYISGQYKKDQEEEKEAKGGYISPEIYRHMAKGGRASSADPFAEFGGYEVKPSTSRETSSDDPFAEFGGYEVKSPFPKKKEGDDYLSLIGKSIASGLAGIGDLPSNVLKGIESAGDYMEKERLARSGVKSRQLMAKPSSYVPAVGTIAKKRLGIGEVDAGDDVLKKMVSKAVEYGIPTGVFGLVGKGAKLMGAAGSAAKAAGLGATVATGEEMGIPSFITEAAALSRGMNKGNIPIFRKIADKASSVTKAGRIKVAERKVGELLRNYGSEGKGDLSNILNFDEKAKRLVTPTTAEVAQNTGISHLHNATVGKMPLVGEKMTANDAILRKELQKIGKGLNLDKNEMAQIARDQIEANLTQAVTKRAKTTEPLYKKLEEDTTRVKPEQFTKSVDKAASKEIGEIKTKLEKLKTILPEAQKGQISSLEKRLADLDKNPLGSFTTEHKSLASKIAELKETATPGQIDKMITNVGEKIAKLKENPSANGTLIKKYTEVKTALEKDLVGTATGKEARLKYRELSEDVNKIQQDKLLSKFTDKDKYGQHKAPVDNLLDNVLSAPVASVKAYKNQIKGTAAERSTSAFIRNKYLGAAEEGLPTYHKSKQWVQQYGQKAKELLIPEDYNRILNAKLYLKKRNNVQTANKGINSLTAEKLDVAENLAEHLGKEYTTTWFNKVMEVASKTPKVGGLAKFAMDGQMRRTLPYKVLEEAMTNPAVAKRLLQSLKPADAKKVRDLLPAIILEKTKEIE